MIKILIIPLFIFLYSCTNESGARMGLFTGTAPVLAILHDDLFTGTSIGYPDRTGKIEVTSAIDPELSCMGEFYYTGHKTGSANLVCNDGNIASLKFTALTNLSGYGYGTSTRGPVSFTYGLTSSQSEKYLKLPEGKKLSSDTSNPQLIEL
jgi:hypothetical protein